MWNEVAMEEENMKSKRFDIIDMFHDFSNNLSYTNLLEMILDAI